MNWHAAEQARIEKELSGEARTDAISILSRDYFRKFDTGLEQCYSGPVYLKEPEVAFKVIEQLKRFDGTWYRLIAYTIMPNHVHVLLDFSIQSEASKSLGGSGYVNLDVVMNRIKGASARYANLVLGRTGEAFWQAEYHDRYIRNRRHLLAAIDYIKQNPVSAKICLHWREHLFTWVNNDFW